MGVLILPCIFYPPPEDANSYPGVECLGIIESVGENVSRWKVGDKVCALLSGGGYAEKVAVPATQVLLIPSRVSLSDATSLPEIHGGSSGIGTFAIQIAKFNGAKVFVTAAFCKDLGADICINYKTEDFVARVMEESGGKGVDVILDCVGAAYLQRNLDSLNVNCRLLMIGAVTGFVAELNMGAMFAKRLSIQAEGSKLKHDAATALRTRSVEEKPAIVNEVEKNVWPAIMSGKVKPVIYQQFPLGEAAEAHRLMESGNHIGKILLIP
ncbi:Beta-galactosidase 8 [Hibiscus syriacus]|uniref:Beta-galactosidase 8 n=1 Tax=Hibiscus syriacus TaxID=106335 RepID=A0A6A3AVQ5_HIBSY|nr:Beta-galactosidase 8 [Hibiscus syriacus]